MTTAWTPKRAHLAMGCLAIDGSRGTFLFASERPADREPVSPVFPSPNGLDQLLAWCRANDWHRMGPGDVGDFCRSDSAWFQPHMKRS